MKIAHVYYRPSGGVYKKIIGQAKAAKELGYPIDHIVISEESLKRDHGVRRVPLEFSKNPLGRKTQNIFFRYRHIRKSLDFDLYDRIILRYPGVYDLTSKKFYQDYGHKIITDHHSMLVDELRSLGRGLSLPVRMHLERRNFKPCLSRVIGIMANTDELRKKILRALDSEKPSVEISNGVDVVGTPFTKFFPFNQSSLNIVFLSQVFYSWQGLDRLLRGLLSYRGNSKINLFLLGRIIRKKDIQMIHMFSDNNNVDVYSEGEVYGNDLEDLFETATVAMSSLAVFRKNLKQNCSLKTREYLARGIPFVYAYDDVDLEDDHAFCLKMTADDSPVDIDKIIEFADKTGKFSGISEQMRAYALKKVDWKIKIQEMHDFVASLD